MVTSQDTGLTRKMLAEFVKDPRTIRAFENLNLNSDSLTETVSDMQDVPMIGLTLSGVMTHDRELAQGADVTFTDGGPKGQITFGLTNSGVSPATYGGDNKVIQIAVDPKGRLTLAAQYELNSDNITEGAGNLFFTVARVRAAISGSSTVSYAAGVFSLTSGNVTTAIGFTPYDAANPANYVDVGGARAALSGGTGISYNPATGQIALAATPAPNGTYANPTSITITNGIITAIS